MLLRCDSSDQVTSNPFSISMARVHVGGLGPDPDKHHVEREFSHYGELRDIWLSKPPYGYAFIEFRSSRDGTLLLC